MANDSRLHGWSVGGTPRHGSHHNGDRIYCEPRHPLSAAANERYRSGLQRLLQITGVADEQTGLFADFVLTQPTTTVSLQGRERDHGLDWQVVVVAILAVLLRVYVLLAKPNGEEFEGSPSLGVPGETFPTIAPSLPERGQADFEKSQLPNPTP